MKSIKKQMGLTLLELMIALSLGVIVVAMLLKMFDGSHINYRTVSALNEIEENAAFVNDFFNAEIKKVGHRPLTEIRKTQGWARSIDQVRPVVNDSDAQFPFRPMTRNGQDALRIYFIGDDEHDIQHCAGASVVDGRVGYSEFFVDPATNSLMCQGGFANGDEDAAPVTIIDGGIDQLNFRYLVDLNRVEAENCTGGIAGELSTLQAYLAVGQIDCASDNKRNKIRSVLVEVDLISTKDNIATRVQALDKSPAASAAGKLGRQVVFSVNVENGLL